MKRYRVDVLLAVFLSVVAVGVAGQGSLSSEVLSVESRNNAEWAAWVVPARSGMQVKMCCSHSFDPGTSCRLGESGNYWSNSDESVELTSVKVFARVRDGAIRDILTYDQNCSIDLRGEKVAFLQPTAEESVAFFDDLAWNASEDLASDALRAMSFASDGSVSSRLEKHLTSNTAEDIRGGAAFYLAQRDGERALPVLARRLGIEKETDVREKLVFAVSMVETDEGFDILARIAKSDRDPEVRSNALFWIAQRWGYRAIDLIEASLDDPSEKVREQAVFAISQIDGDEATRRLGDLARSHRNREVRKKALFWLAQRASVLAAPLIEGVLRSEEDDDIAEAAVFAVTQLDDEEGTPILMRLVREHQSEAVRKKAIFWLGQSDDPRALEMLEQIALGK